MLNITFALNYWMFGKVVGIFEVMIKAIILIKQPDVSFVMSNSRSDLKVDCALPGTEELSVWIADQLFQNKGLHVSEDKTPV